MSTIFSPEHGKGHVVSDAGPLAVIAEFPAVVRVERVRVGKYWRNLKRKTFEGGRSRVLTKAGKRAQRDMTQFLKKFKPKKVCGYVQEIETEVPYQSVRCRGECGRIYFGTQVIEDFLCARCEKRRRTAGHGHILCRATSPDTTGWQRIELKLSSLDEYEATELLRLLSSIEKTVAGLGFAMQPPSISFFLAPPDSTQRVSTNSVSTRRTRKGGPVRPERVSAVLQLTRADGNTQGAVFEILVKRRGVTEVADERGIPLKTLKKRLERIRQKL